jgi:hypothetical protein
MKKAVVALVIFLIVLLPIGIAFAENTFGKTDVGGTWFTYFTDRLYSCQFNLTESGTVIKMCLFAGNNEFGNDFRLAIYNSSWSAANSRWNPEFLMGQTDNISAPSSGANQWQNITANISLDSGEYHLAWRVEDDWGGKRDAGVHHQTVVSAVGQGSPNNEFPNEFPLVAATRYDYEVSIYAVYTTVAGEERNFFGSISQQATINSHKTVSFNRYGAINQIFTVNKQTAWTFTLSSVISQVFTIESLADFTANVHNFFGSILQTFTIDSYRTWTFNLYPTVNPLFSIASFVEAAVIRNFFGTINPVVSILSHRSTSFALSTLINQVFTIDGIMQWSSLTKNFYGTIAQVFGVDFWTDLAPPIEYATRGLVLVALIIALTAFVLVLSLRRSPRQTQTVS